MPDTEDMNTQQKISIGSALTSVAGTGIALSAIFGWTTPALPWSFLVDIILGVATGTGVVLAI